MRSLPRFRICATVAALLAVLLSFGCAEAEEDSELVPGNTSEAVVAPGTVVATGAIRVLHSGACLDVWGGSSAENAIVAQYSCHGGANQVFDFQATDRPNEYFIVARHSGKCVDVPGASREALVGIDQYSCRGADNQLFIPRRQSDGTYLLVAKHSGMCLEVHGAQMAAVQLSQFPCQGERHQRFILPALPAAPTLRSFAGHYATRSDGWSDTFSPLIITRDGRVSIAGMPVTPNYDDSTATLSFDWIPFGPTKVKATFGFKTDAAGKVLLSGSLHPRLDRGPVAFSGTRVLAPLGAWAGVYDTTTGYWGGYFGPLTIRANGTVEIAGAKVIADYDESTATLSFGWTTIGTTTARGQIQFQTSADRKRTFSGSIYPRPQDGPVGYSGVAQGGSGAYTRDTELTEAEVRAFVNEEYPGLRYEIESVAPTKLLPELVVGAAQDPLPYLQGTKELSINFTSAARTHKFGELLRVIGLSVFESILGKPEEELRCVLTQPGFPQDRALYKQDQIDSSVMQSDTCLLYEGFAESFVTAVLCSQLSRTSVERRRLSILIFLFGRSWLDSWLDAKRVSSAVTVLTSSEPNCPASSRNSTACTPEDMDGAEGGMLKAHLECSEIELDDRRDTLCPSFEQALQFDKGSRCLIVKPFVDALESVPCNDASYPIVCENIDDESVVITAGTYRLFLAEAACIREFGVRYMAIQQTTRDSKKRTVDGLLVSGAGGTGMAIGADGRPTKMRRVEEHRRMADRARSIKGQIAAHTRRQTTHSFLISHVIGVGAGSCQAIQCLAFDEEGAPTVESALVDCGSTGRGQGQTFDGDGVLGYLREVGFYEDARPTVVISHPDIDHYNHVRKLMMNTVPEDIFYGGAIISYGERFRSWIQEARDAGARVNRTSVLAELADDEPADTIKFFSECNTDAVAATLDLVIANHGGLGDLDGEDKNRNSIVVELHHESDYSFLFPGDAIGSTEAAALERLAVPPPAYRLLMASHHGSRSHGSNSLEWFQGTLPDELFYSAGDRYGHPTCTTYDQVAAFGYLAPAAGHNVQCSNSHGTYENRLTGEAQYSTRSSGTMVSIYAIPKHESGMPDAPDVLVEGP